MTARYSWGCYPPSAQQLKHLKNRYASVPQSESFLPYGLGRSYGDSCLNSSGQLLSSQQLNHFIAFDKVSGVITIEAGVSLQDIIQLALPHGWFLPVTPGTKFVTAAAAVANDVHGKNHHQAGSFANHVLAFELLRSDGSRLLCSESNNSDWFYASIGGLGLTGFITWVKIQLKPVTSRFIDSESIKYSRLDDFFALSQESALSHEYTVAWIDCSARGKQLGRGQFIRGNHAKLSDLHAQQLMPVKSKLSLPLTPPISLINRASVKAFNFLYYHKQFNQRQSSLSLLDPFFYPLDGIEQWNRLYGKKGFVQHQCLIPKAQAEDGMRALLECISASGQGSFLVVLKMMGDIPSKGLLSFCGEGASLALDFPFQGEKTLKLLNELDAIVSQAGGKIYPAKDARMSSSMFQQGYPQWQALEAKRDPAISSDFWRRVTRLAG